MELLYSEERALEMDEDMVAESLDMISATVILEHFRFSPDTVLHRIRCQSVSSICTFSLAMILKTSGASSFKPRSSYDRQRRPRLSVLLDTRR